MAENKTYKLRTNFNTGILPDEEGYKDDGIFDKELKLLCLKYNVDIEVC